MPRSGSTLHYQMVKAVIESSGRGRGIGFANSKCINNALKSNEFVAIKTETYKPDLLNYDFIAVGIVRDFRDIIVSLRDFYDRRAEFNHTVDRWTTKEIIRDHAGVILYDYFMWSRATNYWACYEDVIENKQEEADIFADALELPKCSVNHLTIEEARATGESSTQWIDNDDTMLTAKHIGVYDGQSRWREELVQSDLELIYLVAGEWLEQNGYSR